MTIFVDEKGPKRRIDAKLVNKGQHNDPFYVISNPGFNLNQHNIHSKNLQYSYTCSYTVRNIDRTSITFLSV